MPVVEFEFLFHTNIVDNEDEHLLAERKHDGWDL